jgi:hypothetical protein
MNVWLIALGIMWGSAALSTIFNRDSKSPFECAATATILMGVFYLIVNKY